MRLIFYSSCVQTIKLVSSGHFSVTTTPTLIFHNTAAVFTTIKLLVIVCSNICFLWSSLLWRVNGEKPEKERERKKKGFFPSKSFDLRERFLVLYKAVLLWVGSGTLLGHSWHNLWPRRFSFRLPLNWLSLPRTSRDGESLSASNQDLKSGIIYIWREGDHFPKGFWKIKNIKKILKGKLTSRQQR